MAPRTCPPLPKRSPRQSALLKPAKVLDNAVALQTSCSTNQLLYKPLLYRPVALQTLTFQRSCFTNHFTTQNGNGSKSLSASSPPSAEPASKRPSETTSSGKGNFTTQLLYTPVALQTLPLQRNCFTKQLCCKGPPAGLLPSLKRHIPPAPVD